MVTDDTPAIYRSLAKKLPMGCTIYFIKVRVMGAPLSVSAFIFERVPVLVVALIMHCQLTSTTIHNSVLSLVPRPLSEKSRRGLGTRLRTNCCG